MGKYIHERNHLLLNVKCYISGPVKTQKDNTLLFQMIAMVNMVFVGLGQIYRVHPIIVTQIYGAHPIVVTHVINTEAKGTTQMRIYIKVCVGRR